MNPQPWRWDIQGDYTLKTDLLIKRLRAWRCLLTRRAHPLEGDRVKKSKFEHNLEVINAFLFGLTVALFCGLLVMLGVVQ